MKTSALKLGGPMGEGVKKLFENSENEKFTLLNYAELGERIRTPASTLQKKMHAGEIPQEFYTKIGQKVWFKWEVVADRLRKGGKLFNGTQSKER